MAKTREDFLKPIPDVIGGAGQGSDFRNRSFGDFESDKSFDRVPVPFPAEPQGFGQ